jgi:hypothetical protein
MHLIFYVCNGGIYRFFFFFVQDVGVFIRDENDIKNVFNYIRQYIWRRSIYSNRRESAVINIANDSPSK